MLKSTSIYLTMFVKQKNVIIRQLEETVEILNHQIGNQNEVEETTTNSKGDKKNANSWFEPTPDSKHFIKGIS